MRRSIPIVLGMLLSTANAQTPSPQGTDDEKLARRIELLVRDLGHSSFKVREAAERELKQIGRPAVKALREAMKGPDLEIRMRAERIVEAIVAGVDALMEDLKDASAAVRKRAAEELGRLGAKAKAAVPALVKILKDKDEGVREAAITALLQIDPEGPATADAVPAKAHVNGKYGRLLHRIYVPQDQASYGNFSDYGPYSGTSWAGYTNLQPGNWVYLYPHWYIWGDLKGK